MATQVLRPHDCLRPAPGLLLHRRTNPNPDPNPGHHPKPSRRSPPAARPEVRKRREVSPKPAKSGVERHTGEVKKREAEGIRIDVYAGSVCSVSPSPNSLPLPTFFRKREVGPGIVDYSATMDLRRLLRLE